MTTERYIYDDVTQKYKCMINTFSDIFLLNTNKKMLEQNISEKDIELLNELSSLLKNNNVKIITI